MPDERPPTPAHYHHGEANPQARLTEAKVRQIIGLLLEGRAHAVIAKQFGVAQSTIGQIAKGKTWKQVPRPTNFANTIRHSRAKLTEAQVREIWSLGDPWADTTTPHGRLMLTVLGGLAEFERHLILSRTDEGRQRAKARGIKFGRKPKLTKHQQSEALARIAKGETLTAIAKTYNVSQMTICRLQA